MVVSRVADQRTRVQEPLTAHITEIPPRRWQWIPRRWRDRGALSDSHRLNAEMERQKPDLVWVRHSALATAAASILEVNAPCVEEWAAQGKIHRLRQAAHIERQALLRADRVLAVSAWLAQWVIDQGVPADRVRHVPNGTEPQTLVSRELAQAALGTSGLVLGFVGSLKKWHGLEFLPELLDRMPEATVWIAGEGPVAAPLHPRIRTLGLVQPRDLPAVIAAFDVGLAPFPPTAAPWFCPLKVLSYRAQGVPVVATDIGDVAATVGNGGIVLPDRKVDAWVDAIRAAAALPRIPLVRTWDQVVEEALA